METNRKTMIGRVMSAKMEKTVIVGVEKVQHHPLYNKNVRQVVKYKAHDEKKECAEGDMVRIVESRPLSHEKRWRIIEIIAKKEAVTVKPTEIGAEIEKPETKSDDTAVQSS